MERKREAANLGIIKQQIEIRKTETSHNSNRVKDRCDLNMETGPVILTPTNFIDNFSCHKFGPLLGHDLIVFHTT